MSCFSKFLLDSDKAECDLLRVITVSKCSCWILGASATHGSFEREDDACSSMTFLTFLNLGNQGGHITTDYIAVN